jgi:hypothetical protein
VHGGDAHFELALSQESRQLLQLLAVGVDREPASSAVR